MDKVDTRHPQYSGAVQGWETVRDSMKGEEHIKNQREKRLPMTSGQRHLPEGDERYEAYKMRAKFPDWVAPAVRGLVGIAHSKPAAIELPARMAYLEEEAAPDGVTLDELARRVTREVLQTGRQALLVDAPKGGGNPYIALYSAESFINWKHEGGAYTLAVFEEAEPKEGVYTHDTETVYRELSLIDGRYIIRRWVEEKGIYILHGEEVTLELGYIPLVAAGSIDTTPDVDESPILPIARSAIKCYQLSADYFQSLFKTAQPTAIFQGTSELPTAIGADTAILLPSDGKAYYMEVSGNGIIQTKAAMEDERIAAEHHGAILIGQPGGVEAEGTLRMRKDAQYATLTTAVRAAGAAIELSLKNVAVWMGENPDAVSYSPYMDFGTALNTLEFKAIDDSVSKGNMPREVLFEYSRRAGLTDLSNEELAQTLEEEAPVI